MPFVVWLCRVSSAAAVWLMPGAARAQMSADKPVVYNHIRSTDVRLNKRVIAALADWVFDPAQVKGNAASTTAAQEFELTAATK